MTRAQLEAAIWQHWPSRDPQAVSAVAAILAAADAYATHTRKRGRGTRPLPARTWYVHTSGTDLHAVIGVLYDALIAADGRQAAA